MENNEKFKNLFSQNRVVEKRNKISQMRLSVILLMSYRNIAVNKTRSFLTIGGVAIGLGIITLLISLGFGVQAMVINEITKNNPDNIVDVSNGSLENFIVLDDEVAQKIRNIDGVVRIETTLNIGGKFYNNNSQVDAVIFGLTKDYFQLAKLSLKEGNLDFSDNENAVILTPKLANLLGFENPTEAMGKEIEYEAVISNDLVEEGKKNEITEKKKMVVRGILNDNSNNNSSIYAYAMMDYLKSTFGITAGQSGKIEIKTEADVEFIRSQVEQLGLTTESVIDTVKDINSFFIIIRVIMVIFGTIIMSISAMGMLNTLSVSLLQRTREVGILKALGAKRKDVFKMFILEAALISFTGGILGLLGGYGLAKLINLIFNTIGQGRGVEVSNFVEIPYYFILAITIFIAVLGFVTGIMPAVRASKTHALDALRYE
jgi:putative ABC transport system permease protein